MKNINKLIIGIFLLSMIFSSCSNDFLETPPTGALSEDLVATKDGIEKAYINCYGALLPAVPQGNVVPPLNIATGTMRGGEGTKGYSRTDREDFNRYSQYNLTSNVEGVDLMMPKLYDGVANCNMVLRLVAQSTELTDEEKLVYEANVRFLRGHYYFWLWVNLKNIPWVDETMSDEKQTNFDENGDYIDNSAKILADFDFARTYLEEIPELMIYPNKWAAETYYAKMLVYMGNYIELGWDVSSEGRSSASDYYSEAKTVLQDIIDNGVNSQGVKYGLQSNYRMNFDPDSENSEEQIFTVQAGLSNTARGIANMTLGFFYSNAILYGTFGFNMGQPTQWFVDKFRTDDNGLPYLDMYDTNDYQIAEGTEDDYEVDQVNPVDPRLDLTVGRVGVDFLGYGAQPTDNWVTDPNSYGLYLQKKFNMSKEDIAAGHGTVDGMFMCDLNIDILKYSEVLLLMAEMEARVGDPANARQYVNQIRERAANTDCWVKEVVTASDGSYSYSENYAANYKVGQYTAEYFDTKEEALDAILFERSLEYGLEGYRFFDLVRFGEDVNELPAYIESESERLDILEGVVYDADVDRLSPFPSNALSGSQKDGEYTILQNPGY